MLVKKCKQAGFLLLSELGAMLVLGISVIGLSKLINVSMSNGSYTVQMSHANWMIQDIYVRMLLNEPQRVTNNYSATSVSCPAAGGAFSADAATRDLQQVFCSPNIASGSQYYTSSAGYITDLQWEVLCTSDPALGPEPCPNGSEITVRISWPDHTSETSGDRVEVEDSRRIWS